MQTEKLKLVSVLPSNDKANNIFFHLKAPLLSSIKMTQWNKEKLDMNSKDEHKVTQKTKEKTLVIHWNNT